LNCNYYLLNFDKFMLTFSMFYVILSPEVMKMNLRKYWTNPAVIFTALQILSVVALIVGFLIAGYLGYIGCVALQVSIEEHSALLSGMSITGLVTVLFISVCCCVALIVFFRMCGRLKHDSAFTPENDRAMGRLVLCSIAVGVAFWVTTVVLYLLQGPYVSWSLLSLDGRFMVLGFCFLCLALVIHALRLLVKRAIALQQENDLTV